MPNILDALIKALTYVRHFGAIRGLRIYWLLNSTLRHSSQRLVEVPIPGLRHAAYLRTRTSDPDVFEQIYLDQHYAFPVEMNPKLIFDCGANIGLSTLYFAAHHPSAIIYAVEPDPEAFEILTLNTAAYPNIKPIKAAIWGSHARAHIVNPSAASWEHRVDVTSPAIQPLVDTITIADLLRDSASESIGLLKLDIQGAEKSVFAELCHEWLPHTQVLMLELHDSEVPSCSRTVYQALVKYNFEQMHNAHTICICMGG